MTNNELNQAIATQVLGLDGAVESDYCENIADAFRLLGHLHARGWFWRLDSVHDGVVCTIQNIARKTYSIRSATAAKAICECALKTVEKNGTAEKSS